ncbi:MAG: hypothetical protein ACXWU5_04515, partial [Rhodoplanes sp.]
RYQRDQVFRGRHARRFANHPILESETAYAVEENLSLTIAVAQPGQLRKNSKPLSHRRPSNQDRLS